MISLTYRATFTVAHSETIDPRIAVSGPATITTERTREGERLENVLSDDIAALLNLDWAPQNAGDSVRLELLGVWHSAFGVRTFRAHRRHLRRAAERLWPLAEAAPAPPKSAAFNLLLHGTARIQMRVPGGLAVTRT